MAVEQPGASGSPGRGPASSSARSSADGRLGGSRRLPPPGDPGRVPALVAGIRADMAARWARGKRATAERYMATYPELGTPETVPVELLLAEYEARQAAGESPEFAEYESRFPGRAAELWALLGNTGRGNTAAGPARDPSRRTAVAPSGGPAAPAAPAVRELSGTFGRYRILKTLGRGGMGTVYLAEDSQLDRRVALKVPILGGDDPETLARFYREARAAATIDHPNVCPVYDAGEFGGVPFVTMAFVEGRPLADLLRGDKPLPPRPAAAVVRKLALALREAHARGVIHRDLKPANVMINRRREPVVMDFGLARRTDKDARLTRDGALLGTPAYMPPEQVEGDVAAMGPACDIYSLGVILYQMLTGRLPFEGTVMGVLGKILTEDPPRPSELRGDIDPALEAVCLKAMAKRPADRFASMAEFAAALGDYLKGEGGATKSAGRTAPAAKTDGVRAADEGDGIATQLLARLVDRLETEPRSADRQPPAEAPKGSAGWLRVAAVGVVAAVLVAGGVFAYVATLKPVVNVDTTVVVRLDGLPARVNDPAVVVILLDERPVTKDQLAQPLSLRPGRHDLVLKRADGSVVETHTFTVGRDDNDRRISLPDATPAAVGPAPPPVPAGDPSPAPAGPAAKAPARSAPIDPFKMAAGDLDNLAALEAHFAVRKIAFEPENRRAVLTLEAKRAFAYVPNEFGPQVRFYDADDARLATATTYFEPHSGVKKGDAVRMTFDWPAAAGSSAPSKAVARVLILEAGTEYAPGSRPPQPKPATAGLPKGPTWDFTLLEAGFVILRAAHDPEAGRVEFLLEAKRGFAYVPNELDAQVRMYDADDARVATGSIYFTEATGVRKGERLRAAFEWPRTPRRPVTRVAMVEREVKEVPPGPRPPIAKPDPSQLPKGVAWDFKAFEEGFTVLKVEYDAESRQVGFLLEATRGFAYVPNELGLKALLDDADGVRVASPTVYYTEATGVKKGERIRATFDWPSSPTRPVVKAVLAK